MKTRDRVCRKCREAIEVGAVGALPAEQPLAVEEHLARCVDCRAYSTNLRATARGLRRLSAQPVRPSAGFHRRWTRAVESTRQPGPLWRAFAELPEWSRLALTRNRRVMSALAPVWVLILLFRLTSPDVGKPAHTTLARSPIEIFRALKAMDQMLTASGQSYRTPSPTRAPAALPRGSRESNQPLTFRQESEVNPQPAFLS